MKIKYAEVEVEMSVEEVKAVVAVLAPTVAPVLAVMLRSMLEAEGEPETKPETKPDTAPGLNPAQRAAARAVVASVNARLQGEPEEYRGMSPLLARIKALRKTEGVTEFALRHGLVQESDLFKGGLDLEWCRDFVRANWPENGRG